MYNHIPSVALSGAAELIDAYGQNPMDIARRAGLSTEALHAPDMPVKGAVFCEFLERAAQACHERFFGLRLAHFQGLEILGPVWLLVRSADTIGEALHLVAEHFPLHSGISSLFLEQAPDGITVCYEFQGRDIRQETQAVELALAMSCLELRSQLGKHWTPRFVQFRHAAPYNLSPLKQLFGENLGFDQEQHGYFLTTHELNHPMRAPRLEHREVLRRELGERLDIDGRPLRLRVELLMRALIRAEGCGLERLAAELGISGRTLQHRLQREGIGFRDLYNTVRLDLARKYLTHSRLSVTAIAERLHFAETAAFTRFFKRMSGVTPRQYRRDGSGAKNEPAMPF